MLSNDRWDGQSLVLEDFQRERMGEALAYDARGFPVWNSVVWVMPRKNGKTELLAAYAVYRLLASDGSPEILLAAASDKNADRLFRKAALFIRRSRVLSQLARVRAHVGEIVREDGMGIIYRVASDPNRLHGYDPSLVVCDELAQWTKPSLEEAYAALTSGGGARGAPQTVTITTAGEARHRHSSILGRLLDAAAEADDREERPGLTVSRLPASSTLVFNYEAPTTNPFDAPAMKLANPAPWITEEYLARQAANPELTDAQVLQLHGCVWAAAESTFVAPDDLAGVLDEGARIDDGSRVVLTFDGSEKRDETWLCATSIETLEVEPLARWAKPAGETDRWRIPRREVHDAVGAAFERFEVEEIAADPPGWNAELDAWEERFGEDMVVAFETRQPKKMAPACERCREAIQERRVRIVGPLAREAVKHFGNCFAYETPYGVAVTKDHPDSPRKIDGAIVVILGVERALELAQESEAAYFGLVEMPS